MKNLIFSVLLSTSFALADLAPQILELANASNYQYFFVDGRYPATSTRVEGQDFGFGILEKQENSYDFIKCNDIDADGACLTYKVVGSKKFNSPIKTDLGDLAFRLRQTPEGDYVLGVFSEGQGGKAGTAYTYNFSNGTLSEVGYGYQPSGYPTTFSRKTFSYKSRVFEIECLFSSEPKDYWGKRLCYFSEMNVSSPRLLIESGYTNLFALLNEIELSEVHPSVFIKSMESLRPYSQDRLETVYSYKLNCFVYDLQKKTLAKNISYEGTGKLSDINLLSCRY